MLEKKEINVSCWINEEASTGSVEKINECPVCKGKVQEVKYVTVKHFVNEDLLDRIKKDKYYICLNEKCEAVYFNYDSEIIFDKGDMKIPIWFKKDADPKYICYCNHVTEQQIIRAIVDENAKNMKDIIRITGAMKNGQCEVNNPLSKCCGPIIQEIIRKTVNNRN